MGKETLSIGDRIRAAREAAKFTQQGAADAAGIGIRSYQRYESGERPSPHVEILMRLASAFGCTLDALVGMPSKKGRSK